MTAGPEVVRPTAAQDHPAAGRLAALAVASLVLGLVLSNATADENRWIPRMANLGQRIAVATLPRASERPGTPATRDSARPVSGSLAGSATSAVSALAVPAAPRPVDALPAFGPDLGEPSPGPAPVEAEAATADATARRPGRHRITIAPGRVAYLRCDGAPEQDGLFPCPRDRALEQRAFGAILGLTTCRDLAAASPTPVGRADAWLIFRGPELGGIRMRESPGGAVVSEAIRACLEARLAGVRSRVESDRMTVSFRFDIR